ncbi:putative pentatricopeptide repeat-containing protein At1g16830 [Phalaenopsis equestris]|uniref:putative pentatricopeptide repeat-containing protein At1g16830 n=1 Tax=Phalaenopsis equestris TaxID=78828 RepID=UPI0009E34158|nr:putative pentatricopeptide repeat-containing protein At1g16830 [Phalaenopsis equestris]XP_020571450.1 putative pentatricopeptide repeat-containing protein At1g16830 [Phalaenopsis equestris]XP_020571451.1 putative pentatricopeptide repeat-containing protein At1g16830 [Phalaenopsis equestris]XP_020571452.1 putative pentatricopeptide repeat-containing protein At1g16830 [Phalaenopsis equestris]XP_020571453.1 putative pentatricopeptide repeat-containing protein At1g16830 [Phalaenopsis equestris]
MLVRWRRLLHSSSSITKPSLNPNKNPSSATRLSPEIVNSTISNCPSDTIALSFFLWAARQPNYFHAPSSFDRIIPVVVRLSLRFGFISKIVRHLESFACAVKAQTFLILLRIYWRAKKFRFALEVFEEICRRNYEPNTYIRNIVLDIQFKSGNFDEAMRIYRETNFPNFLTFNIVLRNLCESGDWISVRSLLREMVRREFSLNEGTFLMALDCFCKAGRDVELLQLLGFLVVLGRHLSVAMRTVLIDSFCRAGRIEMACEHLTKMVEAGCSPTVFTYTSFIKGLCEAQMLGEVPGILNVMHSTDCQPDLVLYNFLISYLLKIGRFDVAIDIFLCLRKTKMEPDSYTLSSLAFMFCLSWRESLLPDLTAGFKFKEDIVYYNSLITGYCKAGLPSEALKLYNIMIDREFIPDNYSYVGLLSSLCKLGRTELAVSVYNEILMSNPNVDAYVHSSILDGLVKKRKYHKAIRLFRKSVSQNYCIDVVSYTITIYALFKCDRFEEAKFLFEQMKHFGPNPNIYSYNVMLCGFCKGRDWVGTQELVKDMMIAGIEMDCISVNAIAHLLIKFGRIDSALFMLKNLHFHGMSSLKATYSLLFSGSDHVRIDDLYAFNSRLVYFGNSCFVENGHCDSHSPQELLVSSGS